MRRKEVIVFLLVLVVGIFLRVYHLGAVPPGLNRDEASIGYTAYSILKTGKDEYSRTLPLSFESFGDWKLPAYIYLDIPFVAVLGLTEVAVRLPSVLAGIGTLILTFFLVRKLFKNTTLALASMALLAISPWHLHLSRAAYEANLAVFFVTAGVVCFYEGFTRAWMYIPAAVLLALSYYTYHGNHIFTTLLVLSLLAIYWKKITFTKEVISSAGVFVVLVGIVISQTFLGANATKISGTSIFSDKSVVYNQIDVPRTEYSNKFLGVLIHNKLTFGVEKVAQNYIQAFSPDFLFIKGGSNPTHNIPNFGNMYLVEAPFLLFGFFYFLLRLKGRDRVLIIAWLFISPVAASITKDAPHSTRMFAVFPVLSIVTAGGLYWFGQSIAKTKFKFLAFVIIGVLFFTNIALYLSRYYIEFPQEQADYWGAGYKQLAQLLNTSPYQNKQVMIDHPDYSPYIFLLFYDKVDPHSYQKEVKRYPITDEGFEHVKQFGRFTFAPINWDDSSTTNKVLVSIGPDTPNTVPAHDKTTLSLNPRYPLVSVFSPR